MHIADRFAHIPPMRRICIPNTECDQHADIEIKILSPIRVKFGSLVQPLGGSHIKLAMIFDPGIAWSMAMFSAKLAAGPKMHPAVLVLEVAGTSITTSRMLPHRGSRFGTIGEH